MATDYYGTRYRDYHRQTFFLDPQPFLGPLLGFLPPAARILDVGCGSGRDLCWLARRGFTVFGLERSAGLAALARNASGRPVIEGDFGAYDFATLRVDAVLMTGSLVHVPHERLAVELRRILQALDPGAAPPDQAPRPAPSFAGLAYLSLKEGRGSTTAADGRRFYLWRDEDLRPLLETAGLKVMNFLRSRSADGSGAKWLGYVLGKEI